MLHSSTMLAKGSIVMWQDHRAAAAAGKECLQSLVNMRFRSAGGRQRLHLLVCVQFASEPLACSASTPCWCMTAAALVMRSSTKPPS